MIGFVFVVDATSSLSLPLSSTKVIVVVFVIIVAIVETFRYEDGDDSDDYEDKINLKVFSCILQKMTSRKAPEKLPEK